MGDYRRNKLKTAWEITQKIENWPTAIGMRINQNRPGLRLLNFRDGLTLLCRNGNGDWRVIHEVLFAQSYSRAMQFLKSRSETPVVLDLGGHIGLFSLLSAKTNPLAQIYSYEPGPPNYRLFEMNCLANPALSDRIHLRKEAVAGKTRKSQWSFDASNTGGSGLYSTGGKNFDVQIRAFAEVLNSLPGRVDLVKIDIEGAEFELLAETPEAAWRQVEAVSMELHDPPDGAMSRAELMARFRKYGFTVEEESVITLFLHR